MNANFRLASRQASFSQAEGTPMRHGAEMQDKLVQCYLHHPAAFPMDHVLKQACLKLASYATGDFICLHISECPAAQIDEEQILL